MSLLPDARWSRKEAREICLLSFDALRAYLRTGKMKSTLESLAPVLARAAQKEASLDYGIAQITSAGRVTLDILLKSEDLDRRALRSIVLKVDKWYSGLVIAAIQSNMRSTSDTEELLRRISFHEGILKNPGIAVFAADPEGKVILWTDGAESVSGIPGSRICGRKLPSVLREVRSGEARQVKEASVLKAFSQMASKLKMPMPEGPRHLKTTIQRVNDDAGVFLGTVGVALDMTKVSLAQRRLEELARIIDGSSDAIVQTDLEGRITYWNDGATRLTGVSRKDAIGKKDLFFAKFEDSATYPPLIRVLKKEGHWKGDVPLVVKDGKERTAMVSISAMYSPEGREIGSLMFATDVTELRLAQAKIEEQARHLDQTREAIVQTDADGRIAFWNRGAEVLTGYSSKEAMGEGASLLTKICPEYDRKEMLDHFKRGEVFTRELRLIRKDGRRIIALVSQTPILSESGDYVGALAVATDVTELAEARKRIDEQADLMDRTNDAIVRADSQGNILSWNSGAELLTGCDKEEVIGEPWTCLRGVFSEHDILAALSQARKGKPFRREIRGTKKNGEKFVVLTSITPLHSPSNEYTGMLIVGTDVTELRRAEREAAETQKLLETILDSIDDLVAVTDQDRRLVYANKAIERLTGYSLEDFKKAGPPYFLMADDDREAIDAVAGKLKASRRPQRSVFPVPARDASSKLVEWSAVTVRDRGGKGSKVVSVGREMTQRIRSEKESKLLLDLSSSLGKTLDREEILSQALVRTMDALGAEAGLIAEMDETRRHLRLLAERGVPRGIARRFRGELPAEGWSGRVIRTGKPVLIGDIQASHYRQAAFAEALRAGFRSFISVPLLHEGKAFGLFEMGARQPGQFKQSDLSLGLSIAAVISSALRNALLHEQLAKRQAELAEMSERLALAEENERRKIAAELHDETGQVLAAAKARLQVAMKQLGSPSIQTRRALKDTVDLLARALDQVREISHGLHPALLDDIGLPGAVRWLAEQVEDASGIRVFVKTKGMNERLPEPLEASLFRIIQEILANIARHSKASRAKVWIDRTTEGLKIAVEDNGVGFDLETEREKPKGLGLRILRQRVRWLGGEMGLQSVPGKGTLVRVTIPVEAHDDREHQGLSS